MITIKNTQRSINVNTTLMQKHAKLMLASLSYVDYDLGIWLTTNASIRKYNKQYRGKDKATDILSFSYHDLKPGQKIDVETPEDKNLGDLIISLEYVQKDAPNWNQSFPERLSVLLAHGIAHLLGYDHETEAEYAKMLPVEKRLLKSIQ